MKMPSQLVYAVTYKIIAHKRINKIKIIVLSLIAWLLNRLLRVTIEMEYVDENVIRRVKS